MKIIFAGTPQFAASALAALLKEHQIVAVLTQPDRPAGRGMQLAASAVKQFALLHNLAVLQPATLKTEDIQRIIPALDADVMVVYAKTDVKAGPKGITAFLIEKVNAFQTAP